MYRVESKNILTPQNGLNIYIGRTENSILMTEIRDGDPMDIGVKVDAAEQLAGTLKSRRGKGMILLGNLGDPYNDHEEELGLVRKCLKVIEFYDHGVIINTHQKRILRDIDVLSGIAGKTKAIVELNVPTLRDEKLRLIDGEETMTVSERLEVAEELSKAGVSVVVSLNPLIPYVNDDRDELLELVAKLLEYDITGIDLLDGRLMIRNAVREFFYKQFKSRFPDEYRQFASEYEETGELYIRTCSETINILGEMINSGGKICDTKQLRLYKRKYENKQMGEQMTLF